MTRHVTGAAALVGAVLLLGLAAASEHDRAVRPGGGAQVFVNQGCYGCHLVGRFGTPIGPDLSLVGAKYPVDYLRRWLRDPAEVRATAHMPKLELTGEEIEALAAYLGSLH